MKYMLLLICFMLNACHNEKTVDEFSDVKLIYWDPPEGLEPVVFSVQGVIERADSVIDIMCEEFGKVYFIKTNNLYVQIVNSSNCPGLISCGFTERVSISVNNNQVLVEDSFTTINKLGDVLQSEIKSFVKEFPDRKPVLRFRFGSGLDPNYANTITEKSAVVYANYLLSTYSSADLKRLKLDASKKGVDKVIRTEPIEIWVPPDLSDTLVF